MEHTWWKEAVVYEIYPKSFYDSNHDGIGDLSGITEKLPYLKELGINTIWLCPFYLSPMADNGYDIADYYAINPQFGTMQDADRMIQKAKELNIRIILDMVLNHTSSQHYWFRQACADRHSKYRDYYIFKDTLDDTADLRSVFGGSTWTQIPDGSWYFHTFAKEQPDLNWANPDLRQEIYDMINWWLEKGISGFRMDAITYIKKDLTFPPLESDGPDGLTDVAKSCLNQPGIDELLQDIKRHTYGKGDFLTVAEAPGVPQSDLNNFIGENGYFSMIFDFSYTDIDIYSGELWLKRRHWTVPELREKLFANQYAVQQNGWAANYLENHDQPRSINKYFKPEEIKLHHKEIAKALGTLFFFLRGTPFIYQGEELGICNTEFESIQELDDVNSTGQYYWALQEGYSEAEIMSAINQRSRDHARLPMQWNDEKYYGFSTSRPWITCNRVCTDLTVENELANPDSVFAYYQKMIQLRQTSSEESEILIYGDFEAVKTSCENIICYKRTKDTHEIYIAVNMSGDKCPLETPVGKILLCNYAFTSGSHAAYLRPYEAIVWKNYS